MQKSNPKPFISALRHVITAAQGRCFVIPQFDVSSIATTPMEWHAMVN
jgi:hypothetical protein